MIISFNNEVGCTYQKCVPQTVEKGAGKSKLGRPFEIKKEKLENICRNCWSRGVLPSPNCVFI